MDKQKRNKIISGIAIGSVLLGGSIYGLSQDPNSFVSHWFNLNNDANKTGDGSNSNNQSDSNTSTDPKAYDSKEAKEANAKSRFPANKDESWKLESIFRTPVNADYVYDPKIKRVGRNETGVTSVDGYKRTVETYSTVKANTQYRNASDDVYEKAMNRLIEGTTKLSDAYLKQVATNASLFNTDEITKIRNQYFGSDLSTMRQFPEAVLISKGLVMDKSTFKLRYTTNDGIYAFEVMFNAKDSGEQFMYMSGFYNEKLNYFDVQASVYMKDGAVAKDKKYQDLSSGYQKVD